MYAWRVDKYHIPKVTKRVQECTGDGERKIKTKKEYIYP
jgi:hypothetical protein